MSNIDVIANLYANFKLRNEEGLRKILHENVEWIQMKEFPNGGHHHGIEKVFEHVFGNFDTNWTDWKAVVEEKYGSGDFVFVEGYYEGTYKATNKKMRSDFIHQYKLKGEQVVYFKQFADTAAVAKAMTS